MQEGGPSTLDFNALTTTVAVVHPWVVSEMCVGAVAVGWFWCSGGAGSWVLGGLAANEDFAKLARKPEPHIADQNGGCGQAGASINHVA